jgi:hypothetical protein
MNERKTKTLKNIEKKMEEAGLDTTRHRVLKGAKNFKTSWIDLGQLLYMVWSDKLYRDWGYAEFDSYTSKEIGIRKQTALKLLRSYSFLEREEPRYLEKEHNKAADTASLPTYESVDVLRQASNNKQIDRDDYANIRKYVLEKGRDFKEVKKDLSDLIKRSEELGPEDARNKKRQALLRRFVGVLKSVKKEMKILKMLPAEIIKEADGLIEKIEAEIA